MIVGNDQEGDDSVITAHVSSFLFSFFLGLYGVKLIGTA